MAQAGGTTGAGQATESEARERKRVRYGQAPAWA